MTSRRQKTNCTTSTAAERGDGEAQLNSRAGLLQGGGRATGRDRGGELVSEAAEQGNAAAQSNLGLRLPTWARRAAGCTEAVNWYRKARSKETPSPNSTSVAPMKAAMVSEGCC